LKRDIDMKIVERKIVKKILFYMQIIFGSFLLAGAFTLFFIPHQIAPGGVTGFSTIIHFLTGLPLGILYLIFNIPLLILAFRQNGAKFLFATIIATLATTLFMDILRLPAYIIDYLPDDRLLASIYGGLLMGTGVGIVVRAGATTGGLDILAVMVHKYFPSISFAWALFSFDIIVVTLAAVFLSPSSALYAIIALFVSAKVTDFLQVGMDTAKSFMIISDKSEEIATLLMKNTDRGVTSLKGMGMYTKTDKEVLLCVAKRYQVNQVHKLIKSVDENAFVIVQNAAEVMGEGFYRS